MTPEEQREHAIQGLVGMLRTTAFTVDFEVKKKPQGIKVIVEVTQKQLDMILKKAAEKEGAQ